MKRVGLVLTGLGRVGTRFFELVGRRSEEVGRTFGLDLRLMAAAKSDGTFFTGSPLARKEIFRNGDLWTVDNPAWRPGLSVGSLFRSLEPGCLVECGPSDHRTGEPGLELISAALSGGWNVTVASKGALVVAYRKLVELASRHNVRLKFSAAAGAALPALDVGTVALAGTQITVVEGILNGTTNFILTKMAAGKTYVDALKEAQAKGIAEPDPSDDVKGWDTASKILILANACLGTDLHLEDVSVDGITGVSTAAIKAALAKGEKLKLLGLCSQRPGGGWETSVRVASLPDTHPLHHIEEAEKAVTFTTVEMGTVTVSGGRSNPLGAAAALLKDIINIYR